MVSKYCSILLCTLIFISGCTVGRMVKGDYYLSGTDHKQGIESFKKDLEKNPDSPDARYYLGRLYLADNQVKNALTHLEKASAISPGNPEYRFWLGLAYAANKMKKQEWESYESALKLDPDHLKSRIYLAHTQLERNLYEDALKNYSQVLDRTPDEPSSLYNRALALKELKRPKEEKFAWKEYLNYYPSGPMSANAVHHLNLLGDFSFRNYLIGVRTLPLRQIQFKAFSTDLTPESMGSLDDLGDVLSKKKDLSIHIIAYQDNNKQLAEQKAKQIKKYLVEKFPEIPAANLKVSWFGTPEKIKIENSLFSEDESINFITAL
ncbi:MAG: tetratricopeptide repeat protein [Desulfobacula sp.]